jgi:hypothetical protein
MPSDGRASDAMLAARAVAGEDTLLSTLLGLGALALFVVVLVSLHVRRRSHHVSSRLPRLTRRNRSGTPRAASFAVSGLEAPESPAAAMVIESRRPATSSASASGRGVPLADSITAPTSPPAVAVGPADASSHATTPGSPPQLPSTRYSRATLGPLARRVDDSRRIALADARVGNALAALPRERWLVERYALISGHRIPFLLLGEAGVFTMWPVESGPSWEDIEFTTEVASVIKELLPGYPGPVRVGFCRAFERGTPRWWSQGGAGAWIMGLDGVGPWLRHFGSEHGLGLEDLARFNALAGPNPDRRRSPARFPATPNRG